MEYLLPFAARAEYNQVESGITIEVILQFGLKSATVQAKVDTGAQVCLFQREIGEQLGLNIEHGHPPPLETLAGSLTAYGHEVKMYTLGLEVDSVIYFAADYGLKRTLLGREGWMQKIRLAIVDYDSALYLGHYDFV
jgi:hypothetical protein